MPYTMPNHITILAKSYYDHARNAEQRASTAENTFNRYDSSIGKMYPERSGLPQGVKDAIRYSQSTTY